MPVRRSVFVLLQLLLVGCAHYTPYTAEQLSQRGTHRVTGRSAAQAVEACAAALETLGYRVTVKDVGHGMVKTAPHSVMTSATGGPGYATVTDDGLAWAIEVAPSGGDVVLHATPRGFRNGSELRNEGMWVAEVMDSKFQDLWNEIDGALGGGGVRAGDTYVAP